MMEQITFILQEVSIINIWVKYYFLQIYLSEYFAVYGHMNGIGQVNDIN